MNASDYLKRSALYRKLVYGPYREFARVYAAKMSNEGLGRQCTWRSLSLFRDLMEWRRRWGDQQKLDIVMSVGASAKPGAVQPMDGSREPREHDFRHPHHGEVWSGAVHRPSHQAIKACPFTLALNTFIRLLKKATVRVTP
ncbi:hypothetical protein [Ensifer sp. SSB1]|jgi:hypothetical protein|uniref:hypothetical protein n=1 Tax=Ensifer sp. SSB1 TaxID=2795385 RepID=UPI0025BF72BD|nr:hypothetical protein [Ensifer sp. SSB1]